MQSRCKKQKAGCETVAKQRQSNHMHSTPTATEGSFIQKDTDLNNYDDEIIWNPLHSCNDSPDQCSEVVYLTEPLPSESTQLDPQHFHSEASESVPDVDEADTVIWNPEEDMIRLDEDDELVIITMDYNSNEDITQVRSGIMILLLLYYVLHT